MSTWRGQNARRGERNRGSNIYRTRHFKKKGMKEVLKEIMEIGWDRRILNVFNDNCRIEIAQQIHDSLDGVMV